MPTYEYECQKCKHHFDKLQKFSDEPVKRCPKCKGTVKRLIGAGAGLIFKGSGFFITDYKKRHTPESGSPNKDSSSKNNKK